LRVHPELHARPRSNLELAIGFEYIGNVTDDQYVQAALAVDDPGDPGDPDASAQHVLAHLDQTTLSLTLRASYTLSPTVSFQLYAQPFVSAGRFDAYKVVVDPGAADYGDRLHTFAADEIAEMDGALAVDLDRDGAVDYAIGRPDFNVRELRANAVLRWEYRPGSTAFLVWRRDAASFGDAGRFALGDELSALASARAEDAVLVKVSYRWTP
jgi:hypothetical protein